MSDLASRLAESLGPDAAVVDDHTKEKPDTPIIVERLGDEAHVLRKGESVGIAGEEPCTLFVTLTCWVSGDASSEERAAEGLERIERTMLPDFAARGYELDELSAPDDGWHEDPGYATLDLVVALDSYEALVAELRWALEQTITDSF